MLNRPVASENSNWWQLKTTVTNSIVFFFCFCFFLLLLLHLLLLLYLIIPRFYYISAGLMRSASHGDVSMMDWKFFNLKCNFVIIPKFKYCLQYTILEMIIWAATWQNQQSDRAASEDSDQPGHPPSLIGAFAMRWMCSQVPKLSSCGQRRLWSDWADAQADLSLRWAHSHFVGCVMSRLKSLFKIDMFSIMQMLSWDVIVIKINRKWMNLSTCLSKIIHKT